MRKMQLFGKSAVSHVIANGGELQSCEGMTTFPVSFMRGIEISNSDEPYNVFCVTDFDAPPQRVLFACAYLTGQAYGGPEEGGWWYETGEHLLSLPFFANEWSVEEQTNNALGPDAPLVFDDTARDAARETAKRMCAAMGHDVEDADFAVFIEYQAGENYPRERPTYS